MKFKRGVRAEKKDAELFFINKTKLPLTEEGDVPAKKKPRLTLEEKMNQLNCYKNLKPDPNSAPAHVIRSLTKADVTSKRQAVLKKIELQKLQARMNAKKRQKKPRVEATIDEDTSGFKEKKLNIILDAKFNKNLWTSSLRNFLNFICHLVIDSIKKVPICLS